jgi:hypothetical protein
MHFLMHVYVKLKWTIGNILADVEPENSLHSLETRPLLPAQLEHHGCQTVQFWCVSAFTVSVTIG